MDRNLLLAFALSFLVLSLWTMVHEPARAPKRPEVAKEQGTAGPAAEEPAAPQRYPELGKAPQPEPPAPRKREPAPVLVTGKEISLSRPLYEATLDSRGGVIESWELKQFHDRFGDPIALVKRGKTVAGATPFVGLGVGDLSTAAWSVERSDAGEVVFAIDRNGVQIRKTYVIDPEGYGFRLRLDVANGSSGAIAPAFLVEWPVGKRAGNDFRQQSLAALYKGKLKSVPLASLGSRGLFGFLKGAKAGEPVVYSGDVDWAGMETSYFLAALFPDQPSLASARFLTLDKGAQGVVQLYFNPVELRPGQQATRVFRGYAGPKQPDLLEAFDPSAIASINLGWFWVAPLTRGFGWLLHALYSFIPNYGWDIIILTILVRLVTAPLTLKQMRSMERMRRIQPKLKEIQEKYAKDRQRQSEEMMRLYRNEKVNPLGGCLPMVLQLPVFIGLFYALRSSIHLRQAPFVGWITDLSAPDELFRLPGIDFPVRVLPLVMGASMFFQQKITPMQMDPSQARMMTTIMPIMMTFISYTFPSGLVLYWMMSNVLAISHQLWIGRKMGPAVQTKGEKSRKAEKPVKKQD